MNGEPKDLVDGIAVTSDTYEQTRNILKSNMAARIESSKVTLISWRILILRPQAVQRLSMPPIECHKRIQALRALGEDVDSYGRVLAPKLLRAFPEEICKNWLVYARRQKIQKDNLTCLMEFLNDEVEGAINTRKIRGDTVAHENYTPTSSAFHVKVKAKGGKNRKEQNSEPFCVFCEERGHWGQDFQKIASLQERIDVLKKMNRCFLCLRRGHNKIQCFKRGKASCAKCKGEHHISICSDHTTAVNKIESMTSFTYLQTARVSENQMVRVNRHVPS